MYPQPLPVLIAMQLATLNGMVNTHSPCEAAEAAWAEPMKQVHARFNGTPGTLGLFGDSITVSLAFWAPLAAAASKEMPPEMAAAHTALVKAHQKPECWAEYAGRGTATRGE